MRHLLTLLNRLYSAPVLQILMDLVPARNRLLCAELLWMEHRDQKARKEWLASTDNHTVENLKHFIQVDLSNTRRIKQILDRFGWPGESMAGQHGCRAAWLLIQHADHDPAFQKRCFPLLERAVESHEAPASLLAYLTDRIRIHDRKPQMYGTQFQSDLKPFPIEDEAHVDERRSKAGLPPLAVYADQMQTLSSDQPSPAYFPAAPLTGV